MPELGPMMRALELQRVLEDKVTEWRQRSARVAGASVADSYQQPLNFKRHINRRKNSAEINRIIAKYSRPSNRTDERHPVAEKRRAPDIPKPPLPPPRPKKLANIKVLSKSEDNLANVVGAMELHPNPTDKAKSRTFSRYNAKSCEDITAFVDVGRTMKSQNFEENSILNAKPVPRHPRLKLHSICEDISSINDSGLGTSYQQSDFATSTPISYRKSCVLSDSVSVVGFDKCTKYNSACELRQSGSEPDILDVHSSRESLETTKSGDSKKRWKILKPPFRKGALDCLLLWRGKKPRNEETSSSR